MIHAQPWGWGGGLKGLTSAQATTHFPNYCSILQSLSISHLCKILSFKAGLCIPLKLRFCFCIFALYSQNPLSKALPGPVQAWTFHLVTEPYLHTLHSASGTPALEFQGIESMR